MQHYSRLAAFVALGCAAAAPVGALAQNAAPVSLSQTSPPAYYPPPPPATRSPSSSQPKRNRVDLMPIAGYQLSSDVNTSGGDLRVSDEPVYGAAIDVEARPGTSVELMWLYSEPTVRFSGAPVFAGSEMQVATHYFQIGGTSGIQRGRVYLFGAGTLGASLFMPDTLRLSNGTSASFGDTWRFAFTFGLGTRIDLARHVGVRFDARGAAPVYFSSGAFYAGSGGSGFAVSGGIPFWQVNFLGALVVTL